MYIWLGEEGKWVEAECDGEIDDGAFVMFTTPERRVVYQPFSMKTTVLNLRGRRFRRGSCGIAYVKRPESLPRDNEIIHTFLGTIQGSLWVTGY